MNEKKILFIDRDGTLIHEPHDQQIDHINKLVLMPNVIPALIQLKTAGYRFVMVTNQDGLGTVSFPYENFQVTHDCLLRIFESQGIIFEAIRICPHLSQDCCECRKPKIGLVLDYLQERQFTREHSYVIGDRETDVEFARNLGVSGLQFGVDPFIGWPDIVKKILLQSRTAIVKRKTNETDVQVKLDLDDPGSVYVKTGLRFLDHMIEQLALHSGISLYLDVSGDLDIDEHHTVEDAAIVLGQALRQALGDKRGIGRYGFVLPMDEALAQVAMDLSGRFYFDFKAPFMRERVGDLPTELVAHFLRSLAENLGASLHIEVKGENTHHMIEAIFKGVGRTLRQVIAKIGSELPTSKGLL